MDEIKQLLKRSNEKYLLGKLAYENQYYADSISEFYYSMVFAAMDLLTLKGVKTKTHGGLISQFGEEFVLTGEFSREKVKYFSQAETLRNKVDYDAFNGVTEKIAHKKMRQTEEFLEEINKTLDERYNFN